MAKLKIDARDLRKSYGDNEVPKGITTQFHEGDAVCIISPSGLRKSTFLRALNLLETITGGKVIADGHELSDPKTDVDKVREDIGMVFQHFNLFPHITVLEDITLALVELGKESKEGAEKHAMELLERVDLTDKRDAKPEGLSGGQKQRVAIARSLAMNPDITLFDKPTSALSPEMVGDVFNVMKNLAEQGTAVLIVTHEMGFARKVVNRVIFTDDGEFLEDGTSEQIFNDPQHLHLKDSLDKVLNV